MSSMETAGIAHDAAHDSAPCFEAALRPVGVLDSGLGGLSVLSALRRHLPDENFVYCADSGNAPWGEKSPEFIIERCRDICRYLIEVHGAKCIVLACNTATAFAADVLRRELTLPIVGIEPAVKPAAAASRTHAIGMIATRRTVGSRRYRSLVERFCRDVDVVTVAGVGLMECVERGEFDTPETVALLEKYLLPLRAHRIDKLVLGCTHYPFLAPAMRAILGPDVELIEPGAAVAAVTRTRLAARMILHPAAGACGGQKATAGGNAKASAPWERFFVRGLAAHRDVLLRLWPQAATGPFTPEELRV